MRIIIERDALAEAVAWVARSLPSRPVLPILSGMLLEASPGSVTLSYRTDTQTSWRMIVPSGGTAWAITLTVPRGAAGSASAELFRYLTGEFSPSAT